MSASLRRIQQPFAERRENVAPSVQLVSFACGGFTVATNHVFVNGSALMGLLVNAWSELARSGTLAAGAWPSHDRSVLRPRPAPSYSAAWNEALSPLDGEHQG
jgi:hypothetical protein